VNLNILLSTFNGEKYLLEQIDSIAGQTCNDWELLVRDDGSTDLTRHIIEKCAQEYQHKIRVIDYPRGNLGLLSSCSTLLGNAHADYILLCDQDDVWLPDKIANTTAAMRKAEALYGITTPLLVHTDLSVVDSKLQKIAPSLCQYHKLDPEQGARLPRLLTQNVVTGCTVMINRPLANLVTSLPETAVMHDWWLALVAVLFGKIVYLNQPTILYRQHGNNSVGAKQWGFHRIVQLTRKSQEVCASMVCSMLQAAALLELYRNQLSPEQTATLEAFAGLPIMSKAERLRAMFRYGFYKHGLLRSIGFMAGLLLVRPAFARQEIR
jgi:glycosyltransferase involved in cell wall biosynthesis